MKNVTLDSLIQNMIQTNHYQWAFDNYKTIVLQIADIIGGHSFFEIGGGRFPLLSETEIKARELDYTVNDISLSELDRLSDSYETACFDISDELPNKLIGKFDIIYSQMVFEHIKDTRSAYRNIYNLLRKGGVCINFHPTLFSPPFFINYLLPESASSKILTRLFSKPRNDENSRPKFPAYYDNCRSTIKTQKNIEELGFEEVRIVPFYGHIYFKKVPIIREIDNYISNKSAKSDFKLLSSYAYTIVKK